MLTALTADANTPFAVALGVMLVLSAIEIFGLVIGVGFSSLIDSVLPDFDFELDLDLDVDTAFDPEADIDVPSMGPMAHILGWLCLGKVPTLILLLIFLTAFGLSGLLVQSLAASVLSFYLPTSLALLPALLIGIISTRVFGKALAKIMPKEETDAISSDTFVGRIATVIRGEATVGTPAEAKLEDEHGLTHYLLVEPDVDDETFVQDDEVLIVQVYGSRALAIRNTHDVLSDDA